MVVTEEKVHEWASCLHENRGSAAQEEFIMSCSPNVFSMSNYPPNPNHACSCARFQLINVIIIIVILKEKISNSECGRLCKQYMNIINGGG